MTSIVKNGKDEEEKRMKTIQVRLTFVEPLLGTSPGNEEIYRDFVGSKAPTQEAEDEEAAALSAEEMVAKGKTVFPRLPDSTPFIYDYQIKGFFKDTCGGLRKVPKTRSAKVKAFKKEIDKLIFPEPRKIPIRFDGPITECQRPLRAQTMQGERVSLAISEQIPAGATATFSVVCLSDEHVELVREWLDYGRYSGLGQWRNSGKGRFTWQELGVIDAEE